MEDFMKGSLLPQSSDLWKEIQELSFLHHPGNILPLEPENSLEVSQESVKSMSIVKDTTTTEPMDTNCQVVDTVEETSMSESVPVHSENRQKTGNHLTYDDLKGKYFSPIDEHNVSILSAEDMIEIVTKISEPPKPIILSVVGSASFGSALDLKAIAIKARNVEYNPRRFAPLVIRTRNPHATGLLFGTGKVVCTGTRSIADCRKAMKKFQNEIQRVGAGVCMELLNFVIQNITANCNVGFHIRLEDVLALTSYEQMSCFKKSDIRQGGYEPELFPGLIIPLGKPKMKCIVFNSGNVLLTGAKTEKDCEDALKCIYPKLRLCSRSPKSLK